MAQKNGNLVGWYLICGVVVAAVVGRHSHYPDWQPHFLYVAVDYRLDDVYVVVAYAHHLYHGGLISLGFDYEDVFSSFG